MRVVGHQVLRDSNWAEDQFSANCTENPKGATGLGGKASNRRTQQTQGRPLNYNPESHVNSSNTSLNYVFFSGLRSGRCVGDRLRPKAKGQPDAATAGPAGHRQNSCSPRTTADYSHRQERQLCSRADEERLPYSRGQDPAGDRNVFRRPRAEPAALRGRVDGYVALNCG